MMDSVHLHPFSLDLTPIPQSESSATPVLEEMAAALQRIHDITANRRTVFRAHPSFVDAVRELVVTRPRRRKRRARYLRGKLGVRPRRRWGI